MGLLINLLFMTIANIIVIIYAIWQFILVFVPVSVIYVVVQRFYVACSRQLRRIESKLKAPIYSNFQETIQEKIQTPLCHRCNQLAIRLLERAVTVSDLSSIAFALGQSI